MRLLFFVFILTFGTSCHTQVSESYKGQGDQDIKLDGPHLSFNNSMDSLHVFLGNIAYQRIDLFLGTDSARIITGQLGKFQLTDIHSSCKVKVDTSMYIDGKIDGAFRCLDENNSYVWWPCYNLYKKNYH